MTALFLAAATVSAFADDRAEFFEFAAHLPPHTDTTRFADGYAFSGEMFTEIAEAVQETPGVVEVERIGHSNRNLPIWAFHATNYAYPVERDVLVFGGIHAMEWLGAEVARDTLLWLIQNPQPGVRVTVIPLLNPDGRAKVETDLGKGRNVFRRGNQKNIDLNRDFYVNTEVKAIWAKIIPKYYTHSETPLSQPESQALDRLAAREVYDRAVSLHAFGGFLYYPWAGIFDRPKDEDDFVALGLAMEQAQGSRPYHTQQLGRWAFFFRAHGAELDHLYGRYGTRAFLIELGRSGLRLKHLKRDLGTYFRLYNPVDPTLAIEQGFRAVRTLIRHDPVLGERLRPAGTPRSP